MKRKYFGTNGIRGIIGELITPGFIIRMGSAIAATMKKGGTVVIGSDARLSSPFIKQAISSSFLASGIELIDVGTVPTPLVQFAVKYLKVDIGIMVTASHNPPQFNGIKVIDNDGIEIDITKQKKIEEIYEEEQTSYTNWEENKAFTTIDLRKEYINQILSLVDVELIKSKKLKAVVDAGNAVGGIITPELLKQMGIKVFTINGHLDGTFPGRGSEPEPKALIHMSETAKAVKANFAVAHDGDADRAIFGDELGEVYYGDKSIALFEKWILKNQKNKKFVTPVSSSRVVEDIAEEIGGEVVWTPVGCIYVSRKMIQESALLGGEENGGLFYTPHIPVRDGAMATALMAEILAKTGKSLSSLIQELPTYYQQKDRIYCPNDQKERVMYSIVNKVEKAVETITIDGVKLIYEDGWILIRPSGTEPIFRIFTEALTQEKAKERVNKGKKLVEKAL
ncbi:MAG: phosphoglucosamine mutase [Candidatus Heimdallarchaeota archaeon]|nr:phosphoglucosamine mutase [Candidatus Heimdallarchaeota archaeon]